MKKKSFSMITMMTFIPSCLISNVSSKSFGGKQSLISEVMTIAKLILIKPATTASGERSFSMARRIKTWLRSRMYRTRFNGLSLLNAHENFCDNLHLLTIANDFVTKSSARLFIFGQLTESDFN